MAGTPSDAGRSSRPNGRVLAYALAVACFFLFGWTVYRDDPDGDPNAFVKLSAHGRAGLGLWRAQNCHVCHQLYGFGGYLGPDLTHVAQRVNDADFGQIVRAGVGAMPPVPLDDEALRSLYAFLGEMDRTGQGHVPAGREPPTWNEVFAALSRDERGTASTAGPTAATGAAAASTAGAAVAMAAAVFKAQGCDKCHQPLRLGRLAAPDLTLAYGRSGRLDLENTLRQGRRNMPAYETLTRTEADRLLDLLQALADWRPGPLGREAARPSLPWFDYPRSARGVR